MMKPGDIREYMAEFGPEHLANYINHFSEEERLGTLTAVLEMLDWAWQKDEAYKMARFAGKVQGYDQLAFERDFLNPQAASDDEISVDILLEDVAADNQAESSKGNRKSGPNKKSLFDGDSLIEAETIDLDLPPEERICPECGEQMQPAGYTVEERLSYVPGFFIRQRFRRSSYECPNCFDDNGNPVKKTSQENKPLIQNSPVTPELAASIITLLYLNGLPLYRQEKRFNDKGIHISRQTMMNWLAYVYDNYIFKLVDVLHERFKKQSYVHLDETTLPVVENRKDQGTNYVLVGYSGRSEERQIAIFKYSSGRDCSIVKSMVGPDYQGTIQSDGYQPYHTYGELHEGVINIGCWSHALVKVKKGLAVDQGYQKLITLSHEEQKKFFDKHEPLKNFVQLRHSISEMMEIERQLVEIHAEYDEVLETRREKSLPIVEKIFALAQSLAGKFPKKNKKTEAITYLLNQEPYLRACFDDGRYEVSNLRDERLVKVLVLYRKNSLFAFSEAGAERLSGYMTLMATARLNGVDPERYLSWALNQLKDGPAYPTQSDLIDLLPYSGKIPKEIRVK